MQAWLRRIVDDPRTEAVIIGLIVVNAFTLGLETFPGVMAVIGPQLDLIDDIVIGIFVVEIATRIFVRRLAFFRDPWSLFDFVVVAIAVMPSTGGFAVLRALRILRVLRLITTVPTLKRVVGGLIAALPGMGSVVALLMLLFYVFSVMATKLFGADFPQWFGSITASAYTLFEIMTLDSWSSGIVRPVMEKYPFAWAFFVPFVVVTAFAVLNLFIGIVVSAMQSEHEKEMQVEREAERSLIRAETEPLAAEIRRLQDQMERMQSELLARLPPPAN